MNRNKALIKLLRFLKKVEVAKKLIITIDDYFKIGIRGKSLISLNDMKLILQHTCYILNIMDLSLINEASNLTIKLNYIENRIDVINKTHGIRRSALLNIK